MWQREEEEEEGEEGEEAAAALAAAAAALHAEEQLSESDEEEGGAAEEEDEAQVPRRRVEGRGSSCPCELAADSLRARFDDSLRACPPPWQAVDERSAEERFLALQPKRLKVLGLGLR